MSEEDIAKGMVEATCENCIKSGTIGYGCADCVERIFFEPSKEAIQAKIAELKALKVEEKQEKRALKSIEDCAAVHTLQDTIAHLQERNENLESERGEMIELLKKASDVIDYLGDILNSMDAVEKDDEKYINPKIREIQEFIKNAEGGK